MGSEMCIRDRIQVITTMSGGEVCHLHNCDHVKKIRTGNTKIWRICTECERYLQRETDRSSRHGVQFGLRAGEECGELSVSGPTRSLSKKGKQS